MSESLAKRVRSAAAAGWWTVAIFAAYLTVSWVFILVFLSVRPGWVLALWGGGDLTWDAVQIMYLWFVGAMKVFLLAVLVAVVWLTLWARRLRQEEP